MNSRERKKMNGLTNEFIRKVGELFIGYKKNAVEVIEREEIKREKIEEHFPSSPQVEAIDEDIERLEDILSVFEAAVEMIEEEENDWRTA